MLHHVACPGSVKSRSHATFPAIPASYLVTVIINVSCWRMQMRGFTLLTATILTFGYGFAAQAAMKVDRAATIRRVARTHYPNSRCEPCLVRRDARADHGRGQGSAGMSQDVTGPVKQERAGTDRPPSHPRRAVARRGETCEIE